MNDLAVFLINDGKSDDAIAKLDREIELEPRTAILRSNRGYAWYRKGEHDRAIADYNAALRLKPRLALTFGLRALAYLAKGDL